MITLKNLHKAYGSQIIFDQVNFTFPSQGLYCLLGASGCGKSTLLNMLAGFDNEYTGTIEVANSVITTMDTATLCAYRKDNIGFIFQDYNLLTGYSVLENILMASILQNEDQKTQETKALSYLKQLNILDKAHEKVEHLSGGQKQRVAIIRALMNQPKIILADEPTGSLDRKNANEIMDILKTIAKDCLVLVITHDKKISTYSDACIHMENKQLIGELETPTNTSSTLIVNKKATIPTRKLAWKNVKVHRKSYIPVAIAIALGMLAFLLSLSFGNIMDSSILSFEEKNIAFNNGYIKADENIDVAKERLQQDERVENIYYQYVVKDVRLQMEDQSIVLEEKFPMAKASEKMSYGRMPKRDEKEISLSPSLAKKFDANIANLVGKKINITYLEKEETLTICGIFNAAYDDFFLSSDFEQTLYKQADVGDVYALSYDVKEFKDVVDVEQSLSNNGIHAITLAKEVSSLQQTFNNVTRLFTIVSILILCIAVFISIVLLKKLQNTRYHEMGLLSALGFDQMNIKAILYYEHFGLSLMAVCFNIILLLITYSIMYQFQIQISLLQYVLSLLGCILIVFILTKVTTHNLRTIGPAQALKK